MLLIRALLKQPVPRTPVWMMRQAGRYLPEYRLLRKKAGSFMQLCKNAELACEITLQPIRRFSLDAAIIFSDILTIPDAMGLGLFFVEGEGPCFERPLNNTQSILDLAIPDPEVELRYVSEAIRLCRAALPTDIPLIGFSGSPWTLATYMIEGGKTQDFFKIKSLMFNEPKILQILLDKLSQAVVLYLKAQILAGAQVVMLFDTWGGVLAGPYYRKFSLFYLNKIIQELNEPKIPSIVFTKGGGQWLSEIADIGCTCVGLDWTVDIDYARAKIGDRVALQGNLDPAILLANPAAIQTEVATILAKYGAGSGHVFNLGHGISQYTPVEHVEVLLRTVQELSPQYHTNNG